MQLSFNKGLHMFIRHTTYIIMHNGSVSAAHFDTIIIIVQCYNLIYVHCIYYILAGKPAIGGLPCTGAPTTAGP